MIPSDPRYVQHMNTTTTQTQATEDPRCCPADLKVGDGATYHYGSDCRPATVIAISADRRRVTVQSDEEVLVSGSADDGSAKYEYKANPEGATYECRYYKETKRRYGGFRTSSASGNTVTLGHRRYYYDPHI